jgi:hypothetical protein
MSTFVSPSNQIQPHNHTDIRINIDHVPARLSVTYKDKSVYSKRYSLNSSTKESKYLPTDNIDNNANSNNIEYIGNSIKFKCHLYDDGILPKPKLTLDKIKSFKYDYEFEFTKEFLDSVIKKATIFKEVSKLYLYTEDDKLVWGLMDKAMTNTDSIVMIGDDIDFEMDEFILNLDNVRLWNLNGDNAVKFRINKMGIGNIETKQP